MYSFCAMYSLRMSFWMVPETFFQSAPCFSATTRYMAHKTEAGGVALDIQDEPVLRAAFAAMRQRTGSVTFAVEALVRWPGSVELIMGVRQDASFGPVAMVGIGGTAAELLADTALGLAPLTGGRARRMLGSLRHAALLTGWRGAEPVDIDAAATALVGISVAGAEHPEYSNLEVNPVLAHPGGAIAIDAHGVLAPPGPRRHP